MSAEEKEEPKIGTGHASAMFRQGLAELRGALYPESNVAQPTTYGIYGTRTPGEVMQERGVLGRDADAGPKEGFETRLAGSDRGDQGTNSGRDGPERD